VCLLSILLLVVVNGQIIRNWGDALPIGPTPVTYHFPLLATLTISADVNATFTLSLYPSLQVQIQGIKPLSFSIAVGYNLSVTPASATVNANFTTPPLSADSLVTAQGNTVGCVQFDGSVYNEVDAGSINLLTGVVTFQFPSVGVFIFISLTSTSYAPALYGTYHHVFANDIGRFRYPDGLNLALATQDDNTLIVNYTTTNPHADVSGGKSIGYFWIVEPKVQNKINGTLSYVYNRTDLAAKGLVESTLHWVYYDTVSGTWQVEAGGSLNQAGLTVMQSTSHFSTWTIQDTSDAVTGKVGMVLLGCLLAIASLL
jgi:hypothetical protein